MSDRTDISRQLRRAMVQRGINVAQMAYGAKIPPIRVKQIKSGYPAPPRTIARMAAVLNMTSEQLLAV